MVPVFPSRPFQQAGTTLGSAQLRRVALSHSIYFEESLFVIEVLGLVAVIDAFCPHLGAHIGVGGHVEEDDIVCPFHDGVSTRQVETLTFPTGIRPINVRRCSCILYVSLRG